MFWKQKLFSCVLQFVIFYLNKVNISAIVEEVPNNVTEVVHLAGAVGEAKDTLEVISQCGQNSI